jgi:hypothetical protein
MVFLVSRSKVKDKVCFCIYCHSPCINTFAGCYIDSTMLLSEFGSDTPQLLMWLGDFSFVDTVSASVFVSVLIILPAHPSPDGD